MTVRARLFPTLLTYLFVLTACSRTPAKEQDNSPVSRAKVAPATLTVTPNSGSGIEAVFHMRVAAAGADALPSLVGLLINDQRFGEDACYIYASLSDNSFLLVNDNGVGTKPLGSADSVANKQCEIMRDGSSIVRSDNGFLVSAHVRFKPAFTGYQRLFVISYDHNQATDGLKPAGDWQIPTGSIR